MEIKAGTLMSKPVIKTAVKLKFCLYARKSTDENSERQVLSIDSQIKEMMQIAEREELEIVDVRREAHSAKDSGRRPVFNEIIADIERGRFNGLLTWDVSRVGRNVSDLARVLDFMDKQKLIEIRTFSQKFTNNPGEKFLFMILGSQAKLENDHKSINVKRGLRTRIEMGLWPGPAPTGYLKEKNMDKKCHVLIDPERGPIIKKMFEKVAYEKWSGKKIYNWLRFDLNLRTAKGKKHLSLGNIFRNLYNPFYYGVLEYPKRSDTFYAGKHEPLISKELFDLAQQQLKSQLLRVENKEFAFTRLLTCGLCGSGISTDEKFKNLKNGTVNRYVYYGCTKARDMHCKCGYINELELIEQFIKLIDKIDLDETNIRTKLKAEVERMKKFNISILGTNNEKTDIQDIDIRNYAKYILKDGSVIEKRELLNCIKNKILLNDKTISLLI